MPEGKGWLGAPLIKCLHTVQIIEAPNAREPCGVGFRGKAPGEGPGGEAPGSSCPGALVFVNAETAFSTQTYIHKIVKFKTLLQTKIRQPMFVERFASFCSNYIPIFQNFRHDFFPNFQQIWPMFRDFFFFFFFVGGKMGPMFTDFLGIKFTHLGGTSPYIYIYEVPSPSPPPLGPSCGGTQIILISSIYGREFRNQTMKSVGKVHLFERVTLTGTLEWRGTLRVSLSPGARGFAHPEPIGVTPLLLHAPGAVCISNMILELSIFDLQYPSRLLMFQDHMVQEQLVLDHKSRPKSQKSVGFFSIARMYKPRWWKCLEMNNSL